jgi:hypothetical protein
LEFVGTHYFLTYRMPLDAGTGLADQLPEGRTGEAAIYTAHVKSGHFVRNLLLRQIAITNYVNPFSNELGRPAMTELFDLKWAVTAAPVKWGLQPMLQMTPECHKAKAYEGRCSK